MPEISDQAGGQDDVTYVLAHEVNLSDHAGVKDQITFVHADVATATGDAHGATVDAARIVAEAKITLTARIYDEGAAEGHRLVTVADETGEVIETAVVPTTAKIGVFLTQVIRELDT